MFAVCVNVYAYDQSHIYVTCISKNRIVTSRQALHVCNGYIVMSYTCHIYSETTQSIRKITSWQVLHMFDGYIVMSYTCHI